MKIIRKLFYNIYVKGWGDENPDIPWYSYIDIGRILYTIFSIGIFIFATGVIYMIITDLIKYINKVL
jgi:hypothetical protein